MAKTNITLYSSTPSSNTDINNINIDENCPASGLNNAIRELMAHLKNVDTGSQALTALSVTGDTTISSGNLLVGKTSPAIGTAGFEALASGNTLATRNNGVVMSLNRLSSDGTILDIHKDGSNVGSIGVSGTRMHLLNGDTGLRFAGDTNSIFPCTTAGADSNNAIDLGASGNRFKDFYLGGGIYLGGTGSANYLDDYETGSWTPILSSSGATFSYSYNAGHYVKVGDMISCWARITCNATPTGTTGNALFIAGLPFTIYNQSDLYSADSLGHFISYNIPTGYTNATLQYQQSTATVILNFTGDTTGESTAAASAVSSSTQFRFRLTYRTA